MLQLALDVDKELRTNVIQALQKEDGVFGKFNVESFQENCYINYVYSRTANY